MNTSTQHGQMAKTGYDRERRIEVIKRALMRHDGVPEDAEPEYYDLAEAAEAALSEARL